MGSPMVFQTAPPQPASKARMICSPQLVGGADASQKGLRHGMPQKVVASVGLGIRSPQPRGNADACAFSVGDCVDYFAAAVGAVAASEKLGIRGLAGGTVDEDAAALELKSVRQAGLRRLPDGQDKQIYSKTHRSGMGSGKLNRFHRFA